MPELPEVETVRTVLAPHLVGQTITAVTVNRPKVVANLSVANFCQSLTGQTITAFTRRGKYLTLHLQSGDYCVLHFRMTGTLTVNHPDEVTLPHTNLVLGLSDGRELRFVDSRCFGQWWFFTAGSPDRSGAEQLGPEPPDVTAADLAAKFTHRTTAIKTLLLDQRLVAGIGNIYSDEICFRAKILPTRPGNSLTTAEITRLSELIPAVISEFIGHHHVDFTTYQQSNGTSYQTDRYLQVYGHAGQPCPHCGTKLTGIRLNGRSSVYCPHCQH